MTFHKTFMLLLTGLALAGCDAGVPGAGQSGLAYTLAEMPPDAPPGTCWGKVVTPAVIQTVTDHVLVPPADAPTDGTAAAPDVYETRTRQDIVQERDVTWFETPCRADQTPDFIASLQRALGARGLYRGAISGQMDARTHAAIRRFQMPDGLDSGILSLAAARKLGLVAVEIPEG